MTAHPLWLRRVDPRWHRDFTARVDGLASRAARAARDPVAEAARIRTAAVRAGRIVEHGREWAEAMELAESPLDLSVEGPSWIAEKAATVTKQPPLPKPMPRRGRGQAALVAAATRAERTRRRVSRYDRSRPRNFVASLTADGLYTFTDRRGRSVPGVAVTASGAVVEYAAAEPDEPPGELRAANVVAFGRQIHDVVQALSRR